MPHRAARVLRAISFHPHPRGHAFRYSNERPGPSGLTLLDWSGHEIPVRVDTTPTLPAVLKPRKVGFFLDRCVPFRCFFDTNASYFATTPLPAAPAYHLGLGGKAPFATHKPSVPTTIGTEYIGRPSLCSKCGKFNGIKPRNSQQDYSRTYLSLFDRNLLKLLPITAYCFCDSYFTQVKRLR